MEQNGQIETFTDHPPHRNTKSNNYLHKKSIFIRTKNQVSDHSTWFELHSPEKGTEEGRKESLELLTSLLPHPLAVATRHGDTILCLGEGEHSDCGTLHWNSVQQKARQG